MKKTSGGTTGGAAGTALDDAFVPCTGAPGHTCSPRFNTCLQRLGPLHAYLQEQVDLAVVFEQKVSDALEALSRGVAMGTGSAASVLQARIPFLQELYQSMGQLVVQPDLATRRALERALGGHVPAPPEGQPRYSYADTDHDGDYEYPHDKAGAAAAGNKKLKLLQPSGGKLSSSGGSSSAVAGGAVRTERDREREGGKKRPLPSSAQDKTGSLPSLNTLPC